MAAGSSSRCNRTLVRDRPACSRCSRRAPPRPASRTPAIWTKRCRSGVRRWYRTVSPSICSAKVAFGHSGFSQYRRRTCSSMRAGRPPIAVSARWRVYRLWIQSLVLPQPVQGDAFSTCVRAWTTTTEPAVSTEVTTTGARWGSSSGSSTPHIDRIARRRHLSQFPVQVISRHENLARAT